MSPPSHQRSGGVVDGRGGGGPFSYPPPQPPQKSRHPPARTRRPRLRTSRKPSGSQSPPPRTEESETRRRPLIDAAQGTTEDRGVPGSSPGLAIRSTAFRMPVASS